MNLIRWLSIAGRHTKMYLDQQFAPLGINCSQHMYIIKICEHPGISQEQFLDLFYLHPSNITRGLGSLIKSGFITKNASQQDKRTYCLYPTLRLTRFMIRSSRFFARPRNSSFPRFQRKMPENLEKCSRKSRSSPSL